MSLESNEELKIVHTIQCSWVLGQERAGEELSKEATPRRRLTTTLTQRFWLSCVSLNDPQRQRSKRIKSVRDEGKAICPAEA